MTPSRRADVQHTPGHEKSIVRHQRNASLNAFLGRNCDGNLPPHGKARGNTSIQIEE
jgi:hypothetical protein